MKFTCICVCICISIFFSLLSWHILKCTHLNCIIDSGKLTLLLEFQAIQSYSYLLVILHYWRVNILLRNTYHIILVCNIKQWESVILCNFILVDLPVLVYLMSLRIPHLMPRVLMTRAQVWWVLLLIWQCCDRFIYFHRQCHKKSCARLALALFYWDLAHIAWCIMV